VFVSLYEHNSSCMQIKLIVFHWQLHGYLLMFASYFLVTDTVLVTIMLHLDLWKQALCLCAGSYLFYWFCLDDCRIKEFEAKQRKATGKRQLSLC